MNGLIIHFLRSQSGAITVDWVVLGAAIVGIGLASVSTVRRGVTALGDGIDTSLSCAPVASLSDLYQSVYIDQDLANRMQDAYMRRSTETIVAFHRARIDGVMRSIARDQLINDAYDPAQPFTNMGAGQIMDVLEMHVRELRARGAYPIEGLPDISELRSAFQAQFGC